MSDDIIISWWVTFATWARWFRAACSPVPITWCCPPASGLSFYRHPKRQPSSMFIPLRPFSAPSSFSNRPGLQVAIKMLSSRNWEALRELDKTTALKLRSSYSREGFSLQRAFPTSTMGLSSSVSLLNGSRKMSTTQSPKNYPSWPDKIWLTPLRDSENTTRAVPTSLPSNSS